MNPMRLLKLLPAVVLVLSAGASLAQGWFEYINQDEFFLAAMPAQPVISDTTYRAPSGAVLPAKQFVSTEGQRRYTVTVAHFMNASQADQDAALAHALQTYRSRPGKITYDLPQLVEGLPAHMIYHTYDDGSRSATGIMWHPKTTGHRGSGRLYILEGRVPMGAAPPIQFPQSFFYQDEQGRLDFNTVDGKYVRNLRGPAATNGSMYGSRDPAVCPPGPAAGQPTPAQAARYIQCTLEGVGDGTMFLIENIQIREIAELKPYDASLYPDLDAAHPVYRLRGSLTRYACEREGRNVAWGRADPGANCSTFQEANAAGYCYRTRANQWSCSMTDLHQVRADKIAPPK